MLEDFLLKVIKRHLRSSPDGAQRILLRLDRRPNDMLLKSFLWRHSAGVLGQTRECFSTRIIG